MPASAILFRVKAGYAEFPVSHYSGVRFDVRFENRAVQMQNGRLPQNRLYFLPKIGRLHPILGNSSLKT
jgi:hypothetical protein